MTDKIRNVFVSHIHEDDAEIGKLKNLLEKRGFQLRDYSVSKDNPNNAKDPAYIKQSILKPRLDACGILAVIVTPDTKDSEYVKWEVEYAKEHNKRIVCIRAHGHAQCEIPEVLDDYADSFVGWDGECIIKALEGANYTDNRPKRPLNPPDC